MTDKFKAEHAEFGPAKIPGEDTGAGAIEVEVERLRGSVIEIEFATGSRRQYLKFDAVDLLNVLLRCPPDRELEQ